MTSIQYFDDVASQWDSLRADFYPEEVRIAALAKAMVVPGRMAADIGAGSGFITEALLNMELQVIAVDPSAAMLRVMKAKFGKHTGSVSYRTGRAEALPIETNRVDYAFANMSLHHVDDPAQAIREMARIVRPGGRVVITDLDRHDFTFLAEEHHDRWPGFERAEIAAWMTEAGLVRVKVQGAGCNCYAVSQCAKHEAQVSIFLALATKAGM